MLYLYYTTLMAKFKLKTIREAPGDKELLALWREVVFKQAGGRCEYPGCRKAEYLNAHHIYSRSHRSTRYDPSNGMCLCSGHHTLNRNSAHHDPDFKEIIIAAGVRTREFYDRLRFRAFTPAKTDRWLIKLDLENEVKKYQ